MYLERFHAVCNKVGEVIDRCTSRTTFLELQRNDLYAKKARFIPVRCNLFVR